MQHLHARLCLLSLLLVSSLSICLLLLRFHLAQLHGLKRVVLFVRLLVLLLRMQVIWLGGACCVVLLVRFCPILSFFSWQGEKIASRRCLYYYNVPVAIQEVF